MDENYERKRVSRKARFARNAVRLCLAGMIIAIAIAWGIQQLIGA